MTVYERNLLQLISSYMSVVAGGSELEVAVVTVSSNVPVVLARSVVSAVGSEVAEELAGGVASAVCSDVVVELTRGVASVV